MKHRIERWAAMCALGLVWAGVGCGGEAERRPAGGLEAAFEDAGDGAEIPSLVAEELALALDAEARAAIVQAWQARRHEVTGFLERRSRGWQIIDTRKAESGQVFDYVRAETLYPDAPDAPFATPPATPAWGGEGVAAGRARTEFETDPALRPPPGTIPVVRPYLEPYVNGEVRARDLAEYIELAWPKPTPSFVNNRLYGFHRDSRANIGTAGHINLWDYKEVAADEMSLLQNSTHCWGASGALTLEAIEVGFQKLPGLYNDNNVHLFTFFRTAGGAHGDRVGGYNMTVQGFIQAAGAPFPPGAGMDVNTFSTIDGPQYECKLETQLFQGNWWVYACGSWIGYYPTQHSVVAPGSRINFDLIGSEACEVMWYGEIYDALPATWTNADMGSGRFAGEGWARAAYIREPFLIHHDLSSTWFSSLKPAPGSGYDPDCYTASEVFSSYDQFWGRWFYVGGPGGNNPGCN